MYLTVPMPIAQHRMFRCHYVPANTELPVLSLSLLIPTNASFSQIKERIASITGGKAANVSRQSSSLAETSDGVL
jgi:hypothetical protein